MNVEDMDVFKFFHPLTINIYQYTKKYSADEKFGLVSKIRRAASSVPMNLVGGSHRNNRKEYRQLVGIAKGYITELKYQLMLSNDLDYLDKEFYSKLLETTNRFFQMLEKLNNSLKRELVQEKRQID